MFYSSCLVNREADVQMGQIGRQLDWQIDRQMDKQKGLVIDKQMDI
jgi:hypothetical protein